MTTNPEIRRVIVETPFRADNDEKAAVYDAYLNACLRDCVLRGETPYASHAILTRPGVLDDNRPEERALGIKLGSAWLGIADVVVYEDLGVSAGMQQRINEAAARHLQIERRTLPWEVGSLFGVKAPVTKPGPRLVHEGDAAKAETASKNAAACKCQERVMNPVPKPSMEHPGKMIVGYVPPCRLHNKAVQVIYQEIGRNA